MFSLRYLALLGVQTGNCWPLCVRTEKCDCTTHASPPCPSRLVLHQINIIKLRKQNKLYLFDKVLTSLSMQEGPGPEGQRGARVVWVCDGKYLLVPGFDRYNIPQI